MPDISCLNLSLNSACVGFLCYESKLSGTLSNVQYNSGKCVMLYVEIHDIYYFIYM
uniref:Uncharacterized protein n=1 Tax=Anguilla anguilla TaxID=7936 RepID=A0A0E9SPH6_ANGAN